MVNQHIQQRQPAQGIDLPKALPGCRIFSDSVVKGSRPVSLGGLDFTESVESLDLSGRGITDISALSGCSELRELNLSNNPIADISTLALLPKLTSLDLSATGRSDLDNELLSSLRSLSYLKLENNDGVTAEGIDALQSALPSCQIVHEPKYYTVVFGDQSFSSDASDVTVDALGLTTLSGIAPLAELFSVEELQLGYNNLCDLSALTGHTALRRVILDHNALRDITALSGCTALEELDLSYNDLNSLAALRSLTQLRTLNITGNPALTADMVRSLQEALPACQIITDIDLSMPEPTPEPPAETPQP